MQQDVGGPYNERKESTQGEIMSSQSVSTLAYVTLWQPLYEPRCIHVINDNAMASSLFGVTDASIHLTVV